MIQLNPQKKLSTMRLEYFPTLEYFWNLSQCDLLILTDQYPYSQKTILTTSAPINDTNIMLRIPVKHDKEIMPIFKKNISYRNRWPEKHLLTLKHQYKSQPYAYLYFPALNQLLNAKVENLSQFLTDQIKLIADWLHFSLKSYRASDMDFNDDNNQNVIDWCHTFKYTEYINSPFVFDKGFVDTNELRRHHISIHQFTNPPEAHIFQHYKEKSILSFLFQFGPEAGFLIRQFNPEG